MGTIKNRNGINLTEEEDTKKRWQQYAEVYKKYLNDPDNYNGVIIHLEPDIQEFKVKWALGSKLRTKLVDMIEFQLSYFQS